MNNATNNASQDNSIFNTNFSAEMQEGLSRTLMNYLWRNFHKSYKKGTKYVTKSNLDKFNAVLTPTIMRSLDKEVLKAYKTHFNPEGGIKASYPKAKDGWNLYASDESDVVVIMNIFNGRPKEVIKLQ